MIVNLNVSDVLICEFIGRMRSLIARSSNVKDQKIGQQDGSNADIMGFKAEYAFAKYFNVFPDFGLTPRSGSYDGVLEKNGKKFRYDIKSTHIKKGHLLATLKVNPDVDIYVLCIVDNSQIDIKGYAKKEDFIRSENIKPINNIKGYCLEQSKLTKFKDDLTIN